MADEAPLTSEGDGEGLSRKIGPLPLWAWALIAGGLGFWWWKHRSSSTGSTTADGGAFPGGSGGGLVNPPVPTTTPSSKDCKDRKDPKGHVHHVCGNGHWVLGPGGLYSWVQGTLKGPIPSSTGGGKTGGPPVTRGGGPGTGLPSGGGGGTRTRVSSSGGGAGGMLATASNLAFGSIPSGSTSRGGKFVTTKAVAKAQKSYFSHKLTGPTPAPAPAPAPPARPVSGSTAAVRAQQAFNKSRMT